MTADPVVDDGAVVTLALGSNRNYTFSFVLPSESEIEAGTFEVTGSTLTLTPSPPTAVPAQTFTVVRDGDSMTMTGIDTYEFDPQAGEEVATMVVTLVR